MGEDESRSTAVSPEEDPIAHVNLEPLGDKLSRLQAVLSEDSSRTLEALKGGKTTADGSKPQSQAHKILLKQWQGQLNDAKEVAHQPEGNDASSRPASPAAGSKANVSSPFLATGNKHVEVVYTPRGYRTKQVAAGVGASKAFAKLLADQVSEATQMTDRDRLRRRNEAAALSQKERNERGIVSHSGYRPLQNPTKVPVSEYAGAQLRLLRHSLDVGSDYHQHFGKHCVDVAERKRDLRVQKFIDGKQVDYVASNAKAVSSASPHFMLEDRQARQLQLFNRSTAGDMALSDWFNAQSELRRHFMATNVKIKGGKTMRAEEIPFEKSDLALIIAKNWATNVYLALSGEVFCAKAQQIHEADMERQKLRNQKLEQRNRMTMDEISRGWTTVRRCLRAYVVRFKNRRVQEPTNLLRRFLLHYKRMNELTNAIPNYVGKVILCQRQVRTYIRSRQARMVVLHLQYLRRECAINRMPNEAMDHVQYTEEVANHLALSTSMKHNSMLKTRASFKVDKKRDLERPAITIKDVPWVPQMKRPGQQVTDYFTRLRLVSNECSALIKRHVRELVRFDKDFKFYVHEKHIYDIKGLEGHGVRPPVKPKYPTFSLLASAETMNVLVRLGMSTGNKGAGGSKDASSPGAKASDAASPKKPQPPAASPKEARPTSTSPQPRNESPQPSVTAPQAQRRTSVTFQSANSTPATLSPPDSASGARKKIVRKKPAKRRESVAETEKTLRRGRRFSANDNLGDRPLRLKTDEYYANLLKQRNVGEMKKFLQVDGKYGHLGDNRNFKERRERIEMPVKLKLRSVENVNDDREKERALEDFKTVMTSHYNVELAGGVAPQKVVEEPDPIASPPKHAFLDSMPKMPKGSGTKASLRAFTPRLPVVPHQPKAPPRPLTERSQFRRVRAPLAQQEVVLFGNDSTKPTDPPERTMAKTAPGRSRDFGLGGTSFYHNDMGGIATEISDALFGIEEARLQNLQRSQARRLR